MKIEILNKALRKSAGFMLRDFNEIAHLKHNITKARGFINSSQKRMHEILLQECEKYFPEHEIISCSSMPNKTRSYLMLEPLDSISNIENALPFFGSMIFISTTKGNITSENALIYLPCTDQFCYASSNDGVFIETGNNSARKKAIANFNAPLCAIEQLSPSLIENFTNLSISSQNIRVLGSSAYSLMLLANGSASSCILNNNTITNLVANLISSKLNFTSQQIENCTIYWTKKTTRAKLTLFK